MRCVRKSVIVLAALVALAFSTSASAADTYKVSVTLSHAGETFASPAFVVHANKEAKVAVSGDGGYELKFTVTDLAQDKIQVAANVISEYGSMDPIMIVHPDTAAAVSVGDLRLEITVSRGGG
jgi:hypothetical protein